MRRREFITLFGSAAATWPLASRAQQGSPPIVGFIRSSTAQASTYLAAAFCQGLRSAGVTEGRDVVIEYRYAENHGEWLPGLVKELVRGGAAVIVGNTSAARAAKDITASVPIVFVTGADPVTNGLVASLNRPGGNVTGIFFATAELATKRLGLLHEMVPKATVIAALLDLNSPGLEDEHTGLESARYAISQRIVVETALNEHDLDSAFASIMKAGAGALHVGGGPFFLGQRRRIVALATSHALPAIHVVREYCEAGGLMSYGPSQKHAYRKAGIYAARIIKGTKPADLPVEQPTEFDLVINLKTAKALGLTVPFTLLARADEVIE